MARTEELTTGLVAMISRISHSKVAYTASIVEEPCTAEELLTSQQLGSAMEEFVVHKTLVHSTAPIEDHMQLQRTRVEQLEHSQHTVAEFDFEAHNIEAVPPGIQLAVTRAQSSQLGEVDRQRVEVVPDTLIAEEQRVPSVAATELVVQPLGAEPLWEPEQPASK